jgi:hypothetical protein
LHNKYSVCCALVAIELFNKSTIVSWTLISWSVWLIGNYRILLH